MTTFKFIISTPDGNLFEDDIVKVSVRGTEGDLAVMANHIPFVTSVKPCICHIDLADGNEKTVSLDSGLLSVTPEATVLMSGSAKLQ